MSEGGAQLLLRCVQGRPGGATLAPLLANACAIMRPVPVPPADPAFDIEEVFNDQFAFYEDMLNVLNIEMDFRGLKVRVV